MERKPKKEQKINRLNGQQEGTVEDEQCAGGEQWQELGNFAGCKNFAALPNLLQIPISMHFLFFFHFGF